MPKYQIRPLLPEDSLLFPEGVELLNGTQGRDFFPSDYLEKRTADPKSLVLVALDDSQVVGLGVAQVIDQFDFYLPFNQNIVSELTGKKVGSFSTLCIQECLQGRGIGQLLSHKRMQWLQEQNCDVVVGVSWVSGLAHTSNRVFEKMGFSPVKEVPEFFKEMSLETPFIYPGCGEPPCTCSAIMYKKVLK